MTSHYLAARALLGAAILTLASVHAFAAPPLPAQIGQPSCGSAIEAAQAQWRALSHGGRVAPGQHIVTSDGRHLTGSQINYAKALIDWARAACATERHGDAAAYVSEAHMLLRSHTF